jgi:hypothetical protein
LPRVSAPHSARRTDVLMLGGGRTHSHIRRCLTRTEAGRRRRRHRGSTRGRRAGWRCLHAVCAHNSAAVAVRRGGRRSAVAGNGGFCCGRISAPITVAYRPTTRESRRSDDRRLAAGGERTGGPPDHVHLRPDPSPALHQPGDNADVHQQLFGWRTHEQRCLERPPIARPVAGSRTDGGHTWQSARIDYPGTNISWAFWTFDWHPGGPAEYLLVARATDRQGQLQDRQYRDTAPEGATGYPGLHVRVTG